MGRKRVMDEVHQEDEEAKARDVAMAQRLEKKAKREAKLQSAREWGAQKRAEARASGGSPDTATASASSSTPTRRPNAGRRTASSAKKKATTTSRTPSSARRSQAVADDDDDEEEEPIEPTSAKRRKMDDGSSKKLSKKELAALSRARAQQWGVHNRKKLRGAATQPSPPAPAPTQPSPPAVAARPPPPPASAQPVFGSTTPRRRYRSPMSTPAAASSARRFESLEADRRRGGGGGGNVLQETPFSDARAVRGRRRDDTTPSTVSPPEESGERAVRPHAISQDEDLCRRHHDHSDEQQDEETEQVAQPDEVAADDDDDDDVVGGKKTKSRFWKKAGLGSVAVAIVAYAISAIVLKETSIESLFSPLKESTKNSRPPACFQSYPPLPLTTVDDNSNTETLDCIPTMPCPKFGLCSNGRLTGCSRDFLEVSENGDQCVLAVTATEQLKLVKGALSDWTVQHACRVGGCKYAHLLSGDDAAPFFNWTDVEERVGHVNAEVLWFSKEFTAIQKEGGTFIALSDDYFRNHLSLPTWCYVQHSLVALFRAAFVLTVYLAAYLASFAAVYPFRAFFLTVALMVMYVILQNRRTRLRLKNDVTQISELAHKKLKENPGEEMVVRHIRDAILHEKYAISKKRNYIKNVVWPRVVAEARLDNRIVESECELDGEEVWKWIAGSPTRRVGFKRDAEVLGTS